VKELKSPRVAIVCIVASLAYRCMCSEDSCISETLPTSSDKTPLFSPRRTLLVFIPPHTSPRLASPHTSNLHGVCSSSFFLEGHVDLRFHLNRPDVPFRPCCDIIHAPHLILHPLAALRFGFCHLFSSSWLRRVDWRCSVASRCWL
jgi:hypothetical protein